MLKIFNEDCLEWLKKQEDNSVDLIITSPPYNLHNVGGDLKILTYNDDKPENEYQEEQIEILNECYRVLKPTGLMFYNHKNRYVKKKMISPLEWLLKSKFDLRQEIIWNRLTCVDYNRFRFATLTERVYILQKDPDSSFKFKQEAVKFNDIWNIPRPTPKENFSHDATFPVELIYRIINSIDTNWNDKVILDIYAGTGTTAQAANSFGFKEVLMVELDKQWNEVINIKFNNQDYEKEPLPTINNKYTKPKHLQFHKLF